MGFNRIVDNKDTCRSCKKIKAKIRLRDGDYRFVNERGGHWQGRICPDCVSATVVAKKFERKIDYTICMTRRRGRWAEIRAKRVFSALGYPVKLNRFRGPDLRVKTKNKVLTVEVKLVQERGRARKAMSVHAVMRTRKKDDLICFVTRKEEFFVEFMKDHLAACPPSGRRSLGELFNRGAFLPIPKDIK